MYLISEYWLNKVNIKLIWIYNNAFYGFDKYFKYLKFEAFRININLMQKNKNCTNLQNYTIYIEFVGTYERIYVYPK